jgi:hypothetical protein
MEWSPWNVTRPVLNSVCETWSWAGISHPWKKAQEVVIWPEQQQIANCCLGQQGAEATRRSAGFATGHQHATLSLQHGLCLPSALSPRRPPASAPAAPFLHHTLEALQALYCLICSLWKLVLLLLLFGGVCRFSLSSVWSCIRFQLLHLGQKLLLWL